MILQLKLHGTKMMITLMRESCH